MSIDENYRMVWIENVQDGTKYRLDIAEDKISKLEDIALEAVQSVI